MPVMHHYENVDAYIAAQPTDVQAKLVQLRTAILKVAPGAEESISYSMPAYKFMGFPLLYFGAAKTHIGVYALPSGVALFKTKISSYQTSKGTIRFPLDKPLPISIIEEMIRFRVEENKEKAAKKNVDKLKPKKVAKPLP